MNIPELLDRLGPCASTTLIGEIVRKTQCTSVTARQRLSRAVHDQGILYLGSVLLPAGGRVYFTRKQQSATEWFERLYEVLDSVGSSYRHLLHHLHENGGYMQTQRAESLCGFPVKPRKGHLLWTTAKDNLIRDGLVLECETANVGSAVCLPHHSIDGQQVAYARFRTEQTLLETIGDFLRRNGMVASGQVRVRHRGDEAVFAGYAWDLTAATYILPYSSTRMHGGMMPGFWVVDCRVGREVGNKDIAWFIEKLAAIRAQRTNRPFTAMMVADRYERGAFDAGRQAGAVLTTPGRLLGADAAKALRLLLETLSNPGAAVKTNPDNVESLGRLLDGVDGAIGNLRGDLFELLVGVALLSGGGGNISMKRELRSEGKTMTDIDVEVIAGPHAVVAECKGTLSTKLIELDQVRDWYRNTVPKIREARSRAFDNKRETYAFWTSGEFSKTALDFMIRHKGSCRQYDVDWKGATQVKAFLRAQKLDRLIPVLERISVDRRRNDEVPESQVVTTAKVLPRAPP